MVGAIIGTAAKIGGSIYGAIKSSQAAKKAEALLKNQRDENKRWYEQRMAEDYTQRADIQNVLRKQSNMLSDQYRRARATNIVAGGTDESLALQKAAANEAMGETMADIAAQATSYKEGIENQFRAQDAALNQQEIGIEQAKAKNIADAAGQMGAAVGGLIEGGANALKANKAEDPAEIEKEEA